MKQSSIQALWCVTAVVLASLAGATVFLVVPGPTVNAVELPEVFPQPCALSAACAMHASHQAVTQVTPSYME